jgi:hypothetical protein
LQLCFQELPQVPEPNMFTKLLNIKTTSHILTKLPSDICVNSCNLAPEILIGAAVPVLGQCHKEGSGIITQIPTCT